MKQRLIGITQEQFKLLTSSWCSWNIHFTDESVFEVDVNTKPVQTNSSRVIWPIHGVLEINITLVHTNCGVSIKTTNLIMSYSIFYIDRRCWAPRLLFFPKFLSFKPPPGFCGIENCFRLTLPDFVTTNKTVARPTEPSRLALRFSTTWPWQVGPMTSSYQSSPLPCPHSDGMMRSSVGCIMWTEEGKCERDLWHRKLSLPTLAYGSTVLQNLLVRYVWLHSRRIHNGTWFYHDTRLTTVLITSSSDYVTGFMTWIQ